MGTKTNEVGNFDEEKKDEEDSDEESEDSDESRTPPNLVRFAPNDLVHMDDRTNSYIYVNANNGYRLTLTRVISRSFAKLNLDTLVRSMEKRTITKKNRGGAAAPD